MFVWVTGALVGNKSDLTARREVQGSVAQEWAQSQGLEYHETSAVSAPPHRLTMNGVLAQWAVKLLLYWIWGPEQRCHPSSSCLAEGDGELRCTAPQFSSGLPLSLPGAQRDHRTPESILGIPSVPHTPEHLIPVHSEDLMGSGTVTSLWIIDLCFLLHHPSCKVGPFSQWYSTYYQEWSCCLCDNQPLSLLVYSDRGLKPSQWRSSPKPQRDSMSLWRKKSILYLLSCPPH